jgi:hypothetical protein
MGTCCCRGFCARLLFGGLSFCLPLLVHNSAEHDQPDKPEYGD